MRRFALDEKLYNVSLKFLKTLEVVLKNFRNQIAKIINYSKSNRNQLNASGSHQCLGVWKWRKGSWGRTAVTHRGVEGKEKLRGKLPETDTLGYFPP